ncbi:hypothetical protein D9M72_634710 [compost metagenome]
MLDGQINDDQPVHPRCRGVRHEGPGAVPQYGVQVSHQHQRRILLRRPEFAHQRQRALQGLATRQRAGVGPLQDGTVGDGIAERHAQFDHVGAGLRQAAQQRQAGTGIGIARREVGHQTAAAGLAQRR